MFDSITYIGADFGLIANAAWAAYSAHIKFSLALQPPSNVLQVTIYRYNHRILRDFLQNMSRMLGSGMLELIKSAASCNFPDLASTSTTTVWCVMLGVML